MNKTKKQEQTSIFGDIQVAPSDEILGLNIKYKADKNPKKVNLGVGAYRDSNGKPYILQCVREAEKFLQENLNTKEYQPQQGLASFRTSAPKVLLGKKYEHLISEGKVTCIQSLSGTGALRIGFEFLKRFYDKDAHIYVPVPTWGNHFRILDHVGFDKSRVKTYTYYSWETRGFNLDGILDSLSNAKEGSIVLFHLCAHNPTGVDPSQEEWKKIGKICKQKKFLVFFDNAYQGFASGNLVNDAFALQLFLSLGLEVICAQSFAKNFGLYGERIGALNFICNSSKVANAILTQMKVIVRGMYSNPPVHGARIVSTIINNPKLYNLWQDDLSIMSSRILKMRKALYDKLVELKTPGKWTHVTNQIGMFTFTGLDEKQVSKMVNKHHIYMLNNGRISMAGLNKNNVEYVAKAIHDVVVNK